MDIKAIEAFRAVAELGSISRASAFLRIAQPALSRLIQKLEHGLGVELLQRSSTGAAPTAAGRVLLERTAGFETGLAEIAREVSGYANEVVGPLRIGIQPLSHTVMPGLIRSYLQAHPRVKIHVREGFSADMLDGLLDETLDVCVAEAPSHTSREVLVLPLWMEELHLFGPVSASETELFQSGVAKLSDVLQLPLILPSPRYSIRKLIEQAASREHLKVTPHLEVDGPEMILNLVRAGLGFTVMPALGVSAYGRGRTCSVPTAPAVERPMCILVRSAIAAEPKVATFVRLFREAVTALAETERFRHIRLTFDTAALASRPSSHGLQLLNGGKSA